MQPPSIHELGSTTHINPSQHTVSDIGAVWRWHRTQHGNCTKRNGGAPVESGCDEAGDLGEDLSLRGALMEDAVKVERLGRRAGIALDARALGRAAQHRRHARAHPVSYTHLTLPTKA